MPKYLSDLTRSYSPNRNLRSRYLNLLTPLNSRTITYLKRCFKYYAPNIWNTLPEYIKSANSVPIFKKLLKTHLFRIAFNLS